MKRSFACWAALLLFPIAAHAYDGYVVADVNLRAGPDIDYPAITMLPAGAPVAIQGCIDGWTWCDVVAGPDRGWVAGTYIEEAWGGNRVIVTDYGARIGIPVVAFTLGAYWDSYYRGRPWYHNRARWIHHRWGYRRPPRPAGWHHGGWHGGGHGTWHGGHDHHGSHDWHGGSHGTWHGGHDHNGSHDWHGSRPSNGHYTTGHEGRTGAVQHHAQATQRHVQAPRTAHRTPAYRGRVSAPQHANRAMSSRGMASHARPAMHARPAAHASHARTSHARGHAAAKRGDDHSGNRRGHDRDHR